MVALLLHKYNYKTLTVFPPYYNLQSTQYMLTNCGTTICSPVNYITSSGLSLILLLIYQNTLDILIAITKDVAFVAHKQDHKFQKGVILVILVILEGKPDCRRPKDRHTMTGDVRMLLR